MACLDTCGSHPQVPSSPAQHMQLARHTPHSSAVHQPGVRGSPQAPSTHTPMHIHVHAHTEWSNVLCMCADTCMHSAAALACILMIIKGLSLSLHSHLPKPPCCILLLTCLLPLSLFYGPMFPLPQLSHHPTLLVLASPFCSELLGWQPASCHPCIVCPGASLPPRSARCQPGTLCQSPAAQTPSSAPLRFSQPGRQGCGACGPTAARPGLVCTVL